MPVSQQLRLKQRPEGQFKQSDFEESQETLAELQEGEILVRVIYLSLDPTQRVWAQTDSYLPAVKIGAVMRSFGLGVVEASKDPTFKEGDIASGMTGWQTHIVAKAKDFQNLPRLANVPLDAYMGPLGMTGITAYFGLLDVGAPKTGETLVVSGAAGAVGSMVCQIGKIKDLNVIGIAGTDDKCSWLTDDLKVNAAINYKTENIYKRLRKAAPNGVDIYFENVGGAMLDTVLTQLNIGARIPLCGYISGYTGENEVAGIQNLGVLIAKRAKIQGFLVLDYYPRALEAVQAMATWMQEGKLVYRSDINEGLSNTPLVINKLFTGGNTGKLLMKLSEED